MRGMSREVRDPVSLVAGVTFLALGVLLVLDQAGALDLTFGWIGAVLAAALGVILVASGLSGSADEGEAPAQPDAQAEATPTEGPS
jgi:peptidoglycan/LPS O-acetylase OafA/YrhL